MKRYQFTLKSKFFFLTTFFYYKLLIIKEVYKGKYHILLAEFMWFVNLLSRLRLNFLQMLKRQYFETRLGKFYIYPDLLSMYTVSPTFERLDIDLFIFYIKNSLINGDKVLVIDVGAHFGTYSVAIGNAFKKYKNLDIISFEPNAKRFINDNYKLLKKNIAINNIKNIKLYKIGLGNSDSEIENSEGIKTKKLDTIVGKNLAKQYDTIFIKIDIEGFEKEALEGGKQFIKNAKNLILLVEDCVDNSIVTFLEQNKFIFIDKITPYNSFWRK